MEHFYKHAQFPFKHILKLFYIFKFPGLQNFSSAQSLLPPICKTLKGGQGVVGKNAIFVWYSKTQTTNSETTAAVITATMSILSHASAGR